VLNRPAILHKTVNGTLHKAVHTHYQGVLYFRVTASRFARKTNFFIDPENNVGQVDQSL